MDLLLQTILTGLSNKEQARLVDQTYSISTSITTGALYKLQSYTHNLTTSKWFFIPLTHSTCTCSVLGVTNLKALLREN